ncbi:MAG: D-alanyl-D-alanine endopeptidase [Gammaproteobacteria bacterium]|nr:D-alanyl-D-alanine endopeptidase [Gammaproteobacteria bacterium]
MRIFLVTILLILNSGHALSVEPPFQQASISKPDAGKLWLRSHAAVVMDQHSGQILYQKNAKAVLPIASITKLMTAMVLIDADLDMQESISITRADKDTLRYSRSRLPVGSKLSRMDLLKIALMASENRAAAALARTYPGGKTAFIDAMNAKSKVLGMQQTRFSDSTGLITENHSTAKDLATLLKAAWQYPLIKKISGVGKGEVTLQRLKNSLEFNNTNRLLRRPNWQIGMSKTGYIKESGRCLVMQANISGRDLFIVLLNAQGKLSSYGDSGRIRKWLEKFDANRQAKSQ